MATALSPLAIMSTVCTELCDVDPSGEFSGGEGVVVDYLNTETMANEKLDSYKSTSDQYSATLAEAINLVDITSNNDALIVEVTLPHDVVSKVSDIVTEALANVFTVSNSNNKNTDNKEEIVCDTKKVILKYLKKYKYPEVLIDIPKVENEKYPILDFSSLL